MATSLLIDRCLEFLATLAWPLWLSIPSLLPSFNNILGRWLYILCTRVQYQGSYYVKSNQAETLDFPKLAFLSHFQDKQIDNLIEMDQLCRDDREQFYHQL